jgi:hypothetical protein
VNVLLLSGTPFVLDLCEVKDAKSYGRCDRTLEIASTSNQSQICDVATIHRELNEGKLYSFTIGVNEGQMSRRSQLNVVQLALETSTSFLLFIVPNSDIAFAILAETESNPRTRTITDATEVSQVPTPPSIDPFAVCNPFDPDAVRQAQYLAECRDYIPLGYNLTLPWPNISTTLYYFLPSGWEVAPSNEVGTQVHFPFAVHID